MIGLETPKNRKLKKGNSEQKIQYGYRNAAYLCPLTNRKSYHYITQLYCENNNVLCVKDKLVLVIPMYC